MGMRQYIEGFDATKRTKRILLWIWPAEVREKLWWIWREKAKEKNWLHTKRWMESGQWFIEYNRTWEKENHTCPKYSTSIYLSFSRSLRSIQQLLCSYDAFSLNCSLDIINSLINFFANFFFFCLHSPLHSIFTFISVCSNNNSYTPTHE